MNNKFIFEIYSIYEQNQIFSYEIQPFIDFIVLNPTKIIFLYDNNFIINRINYTTGLLEIIEKINYNGTYQNIIKLCNDNFAMSSSLENKIDFYSKKNLIQYQIETTFTNQNLTKVFQLPKKDIIMFYGRSSIMFYNSKTFTPIGYINFSENVFFVNAVMISDDIICIGQQFKALLISLHSYSIIGSFVINSPNPILYQIKKGLFLFGGSFYYKKDNTIESIDSYNNDLRGKNICVITDGIFINADLNKVKIFHLKENK